jgi:DNA helicase-2/ATP-dependent DNA helicase PcrA
MSYPNQEQAAILSHLYGTLLVLAPAGTGKTRIMADHLAAVIAGGMQPNTVRLRIFNRRWTGCTQMEIQEYPS